MKNPKSIMIFLLCAVVCWCAVAGWAVISGRLGSSMDPVYNDVLDASSLSADYVYQYEGKTDDLSSAVKGAVLPSPSADSVMTARTFADLAEIWNGNLVLVVTFGRDIGAFAATSYLDWQTPFGVISTNGIAVDHMKKKGVVINDSVLSSQKDLLDILPYFATYFPDKRIAPLVFDSEADPAAVIAFMGKLAESHDGYLVMVVTPEQTERSVAFKESTEELVSLFDQSENIGLQSRLPSYYGNELHAVKHVLKYDGNRVLTVLKNDNEKPTFDHLSIFYGGF